MIKKNILFFGGVGLMSVIGLSLIVHSCSSDTPVQQQQVVAAQPQTQIIERERIVERDNGSGFQNFLLWHYMFGSRDRTVVVQQPAPVYHPAPVVNKTVQNVTINQTVNNHVSGPAPVSSPAQPATQPAKASSDTKTAQAPVAPAKASWWASPAQVVKASTNYPKASNTNTGSYGLKASGYSGYSQKTTWGSGGGSAYKSSGRK